MSHKNTTLHLFPQNLVFLKLFYCCMDAATQLKSKNKNYQQLYSNLLSQYLFYLLSSCVHLIKKHTVALSVT